MGILGLWWQHKPQASTGFTVVVWTMEVFLGGLIQKMNHTCISEILLLLKVRVILPLGSEFGARACVSSGLLHTSLPALLHNDMFLCPLQPCRRQTRRGGISSSASLHSEPAALFSHLSYLSIAHSSIKVTLQTAVGHQVHIYICPNSFPCKYLLQWVITLVHGFWFLKHHQYWTIAETHLGCTAATRSSGWSCGWGVLPGCRIQESSRLLHTSMSRRCSRIWPLSRWHNHGACHYACCLWAESRPPSSSPHRRVSSRYCSTFCSMLSAAQDERTWQWLCSHTCCCLASTIFFSNFMNLL